MSRRKRLPRRATPRFEPTIHDELEAAFAAIDERTLLAPFGQYRHGLGRKGYPVTGLWRAYLAGFIMNVGSTAELRRKLRDDDKLRAMCGLARVPHHSNFYRFIARLMDHRALVESNIAALSGRFAKTLPNFGEIIAIDSTTVRTHSNPDKPWDSDPDASWTGKERRRNGEKRTEWHYGYKLHLIADATYGLPIYGYVTTASRHDSPELPTLMLNAWAAASWVFQPKYVTADKGYDSEANFRWIGNQFEADSVIPVRKGRSDYLKLHDGLYTWEGKLTCVGGEPMEYVGSDSEKGHLFRCRSEGCHLKERKAVLYCQDELWEKPQSYRMNGLLAQNAPNWKPIYELRQSVERVFKSLKESRRLERHYIRTQNKISLHVSMSVLAYQLTALFRIRRNELDMMRWQVHPAA